MFWIDEAKCAICSSSFWFHLGLKPVGPESQIRYFMVNKPIVTKDYISLDINVSASLSSQSQRLIASGVVGALEDS